MSTSTGKKLRVGDRYLGNDGRIWTITHTHRQHSPYIYSGTPTGVAIPGKRTAAGLAAFDDAGVAQSYFGGPCGPQDGLRLIETAWWRS